MKTDNAQLFQDVASFFRRWDTFENLAGNYNAMVLDLDFCPKELANSKSPFQNRLHVLKELEDLREQLDSVDESKFCNHAFLALKLEGSSSYLRALMGEKIPIDKYLLSTMGFLPKFISEEELQKLQEEAQCLLDKRGIIWRKEDRDKYEKDRRYEDVDNFGEELRKNAERWVALVKERLQLQTTPNYIIETVNLDEYWQNWTSGALGEPIRLRINTHPRSVFYKGLEINLAAHEIAGHAMHIYELDRRRQLGAIDASCLNFTAHSCEIFLLEGLAQSLIQLISEANEISEDSMVEEAMQKYHLAVLQNAHLEIENGSGVVKTIKRVLQLAPFINELRVLSDLRDRSRHPMFRALMAVYYPSAKMFMAAKKLPLNQRWKFLLSMYQNLWTPMQIEAQIKDLMMEAQVAKAIT